MHSKVAVQTIKKQTKEGRAEGAALLDSSEGGVGTPYTTPNLDGKAGGTHTIYTETRIVIKTSVTLYHRYKKET